MRLPFPERVERGRETVGPYSSLRGDDYGRFWLRSDQGVPLLVLVGPGSDEIPWEHVSVSIPRAKRCPTWEEMCWIKSLFFRDDEVCVQYHPSAAEYVNVHPYCLHLWKPLAAELPRPPMVAVG